MRLSFAMIGMVRKDRRRAEQLLGEHRADEQVRPGRRAEGQQQVGAVAAAPRHGRRRRRSGTAPRACRRRASVRACAASSVDDSDCPRSSRTIVTLFGGERRNVAAAVGKFGDLRSARRSASDSARPARPPESGRSFRERRCGAAPASVRRRGAPNGQVEHGLEAVVDRARGFGDRARPVACRRG